MEIFLPHHTQGSQKQKYWTKQNYSFFVVKNVEGASIPLKKRDTKKPEVQQQPAEVPEALTWLCLHHHLKNQSTHKLHVYGPNQSPQKREPEQWDKTSQLQHRNFTILLLTPHLCLLPLFTHFAWQILGSHIWEVHLFIGILPYKINL